ncbi:DUF6232 family protein [Vulgatibacter sp.]|uniref:DUF6232 family protein n=1 Tax=Vulgatibacter sp. TaxID=1971226 RepID=UPI00356A6513
MIEIARHEEGPVRITDTALITPAGRWPLLVVGPARLRWVEPDVSWLQLVFMAAIIALGLGARASWHGEPHGLPVLGAGLLLLVLGFWGASHRRPSVALLIEVDGAVIEAWRSEDEEAVQRVLTALEEARVLVAAPAARA